MAKKRIHRATVKVPVDLWRNLLTALKVRAERATNAAGTEVDGSFSAWLRDKARETIEAYK